MADSLSWNSLCSWSHSASEASATPGRRPYAHPQRCMCSAIFASILPWLRHPVDNVRLSAKCHGAALPCSSRRAALQATALLLEPPTALGLEVALQKLSLPDASPSRARSEWLCLGECIRSAIAYLVLLWVLSKSAAVGCWLQPLADVWLS